MQLMLKFFENDNSEEMIAFVKKGLDLLQKDYLGSSGSRGYGKIEIKNLTIEDIG